MSAPRGRSSSPYGTHHRPSRPPRRRRRDARLGAAATSRRARALRVVRRRDQSGQSIAGRRPSGPRRAVARRGDRPCPVRAGGRAPLPPPARRLGARRPRDARRRPHALYDRLPARRTHGVRRRRASTSATPTRPTVSPSSSAGPPRTAPSAACALRDGLARPRRGRADRLERLRRDGHALGLRPRPAARRSAPTGDRVEVWIDGVRTGYATSGAFQSAPAIAFSADDAATAQRRHVRPHHGRRRHHERRRLGSRRLPRPRRLRRALVPARRPRAARRLQLRRGARPPLHARSRRTGSGTQDPHRRGRLRRRHGRVGPGVCALAAPAGPGRRLQRRARLAAVARRRPEPRAPAATCTTWRPPSGRSTAPGRNRAYGDDFRTDQTARWLRGRTVRYASSGPPSSPFSYSRVERDFTRTPDDGDGFETLAEQGRFDVRHSRRGDVARQAAYFLAFYRIEAEDGDEGRAFIDATLGRAPARGTSRTP